MAANQTKAKNKNSVRRKTSPVGLWSIAVIGFILLFFSFINQWGLKLEVELYFALISALFFSAVIIKKDNRMLLFGRITPVYAVLAVHTVLYFAGLFYSIFPKFALQQFFLNSGGLLLFAAAYITFLRDESSVKKVLSAFSVCIGVISLVSIELGSSRLLIGFLDQAAKALGAFLPDGYGIFELNTRITSVLGNPNIYAPVAAIGMFLAVWLGGKPGSRERGGIFHTAVGIVSGAGFVLSFSMGTIIMLVPSIAGILFFASKENRKSLAFSLAYNLIFSTIGAAVVFALLRISVLPSLALLLLAAGAGLLYAYIRPISFPAAKFGKKAKALLYSAASVAFCAVVIAAIVLQGPYSLKQSEGFKRAIYLKEGTYDLELAMADSASATIAISSMSLTQAALKEQTELAGAEAKNGDHIRFTVPEGSKAIFFRFTANADLTIYKASVQSTDAAGGKSKNIPLRYVLLPEFAANRLQAIWVNDNAIQRFIFFRDGIRIGLISPIIGLGGGAYEGKIFGSADYYYETVHAHNHYIQSFIDGGIFGFALFAALAALSILCLFKVKKEQRNADIMFPVLAGSILMIFLHSLLEVDFSSTAFKALASVLFALSAALYEKPFAPGKKTRIAAAAVVPAVAAVTLLFSLGRVIAVNTLQSEKSLEALEKGVTLDPFNGDDYKVSYLLNTMNGNTSALVESRANSYLESIESKPISPDTAILLSRYYMMKDVPNYNRGIELAEYYIHEKKVNPKAWDEVLSIYSAFEGTASPENKALLASSVLKLSDYLREINSELPKEVKPELIVSQLSWAAIHEKEPDSPLTVDSRINADLNNDGKSDMIDAEAEGRVRWKFCLVPDNQKYYNIKVYTGEDKTCKVIVGGSESAGEYLKEEKCYQFYVNQTIPGSISIEADDVPGVYFTVELMS